MEVKFELPQNPELVEAVEVTEDFVLGKAPPAIVYRGGNNNNNSNSHRNNNRIVGAACSRSLPNISEDRVLIGSEHSVSRPVELTEFEEQMVEELALSL